MKPLILIIAFTILLSPYNFAQKKKKARPIEEYDFTGIDLSVLDWNLVSTTNDAYFYLHYKKMKTKQGTIKVWIKIQPKESSEDFNYFNKMLSLYEFNCEQVLMRTGKTVVYFSSGKISSSDSKEKWTEAVPETNGETLLNKVCKK